MVESELDRRNKIEMNKLVRGMKWVKFFLQFSFSLKSHKISLMSIEYELNKILILTNGRGQFEEARSMLLLFSTLIHQNSRRVEMRRLGPANDGGYLVPRCTPAPHVLLSGGVGKNIDFEHDLAKEGTFVHLFDPTVRRLPISHGNFRLHRKFLREGDSEYFVDLKEFLNELLPSRQRIWIKLDIEGDEYQQLRNLASGDLSGIEVLIVEFHGMYNLVNPSFRNNFHFLFEEIFKTFYLVNIHGNNNRPVLNFGDVVVPEVFEATFILKSASCDFHNGSVWQNKLSQKNSSRLPETIHIPLLLS